MRTTITWPEVKALALIAIAIWGIHAMWQSGERAKAFRAREAAYSMPMTPLEKIIHEAQLEACQNDCNW